MYIFMYKSHFWFLEYLRFGMLGNQRWSWSKMGIFLSIPERRVLAVRSQPNGEVTHRNGIGFNDIQRISHKTMNSHAEIIVISTDKVKFYQNFYGDEGFADLLLDGFYIRGRSILGIDFVKWFASPPCHSSVIALVFWFIKLPMHDFLNIFFHMHACLRMYTTCVHFVCDKCLHMYTSMLYIYIYIRCIIY